MIQGDLLLYKMEEYLFVLFKKMFVLEKLNQLFLKKYVILLLIQMFLDQFKIYVGLTELKLGIQDKDIL